MVEFRAGLFQGDGKARECIDNLLSSTLQLEVSRGIAKDKGGERKKEREAGRKRKKRERMLRGQRRRWGDESRGMMASKRVDFGLLGSG